MVVRPQQYLEYIASLLNVKLGKICLNNSVYTCVIGNKTISGVYNIIISLLLESKSNLSGTDPLEKAEIQQWIEYGVVYAVHIDNPHNLKQILNELNGIFATKTYLVSHKLTIADVLLYYILLNFMKKEKYFNVSRWFDNLQQDTLLRQSHKIIDFNTNYLVSVAPSRH
ncbi:hypothetical protein NQ314_013050 [Rhamnusium bicolor]|uniref:Nuclear-export cofactor Arc1-like N-terminal domain-containing protein n=1 Tax=Rhamnusium bicolor TaxID=1586634 RepID=A0AAV8XAJ8_9CUCU|nr:hypothetical protein NQ314_013050 [Rhamnusium bicolor]